MVRVWMTEDTWEFIAGLGVCKPGLGVWSFLGGPFMKIW